MRRTIVLLSLLGCLLGPILSVRSASNVIVVSSTIQAALDAANPGDTILVPPGTYHENLRVTKDNITIVGSKGAVIDAGNRIGIRVGIGSRSVVNGIQVCPALQLHNFTLKGLTIRNARFAGVFLIGVDGYHLTRTTYVDNPIYGPFPVCSANGIIDFNSVEGGSSVVPNMGIDAGIYIGDSNTVTVRKNSVKNYAAGIEIENTSNAVVEENILRGNSGGILVFVLPGLDNPFSENVRIERNEVIENNVPNPVPFDPGPTGDPLGHLPTGTGILNVGADDVVITDNKIIGNDSLGIAIIQNPFAGLDPRIEPNPDRTRCGATSCYRMAAVQILYAPSRLESTLPMTKQVLERALSTTSSEQNFPPASRQFLAALNRFSKVTKFAACLACRRGCSNSSHNHRIEMA